MDAANPLTRVCALLNGEAAEYLIVGAQAAILHGHIRTTEDVDILIPVCKTSHWTAMRTLNMPSRAY